MVGVVGDAVATGEKLNEDISDSSRRSSWSTEAAAIWCEVLLCTILMDFRDYHNNRGLSSGPKVWENFAVEL